jgi:xylan 1,4-beta-xylosidase
MNKAVDPSYEIVRYKHGLNARILMHGVSHYKLHWHKEIEILLVVKGRVLATVEGQRYELAEDELLFINSGDTHSTQGDSDNIVIALQINPAFCAKVFPALDSLVFCWPRKRDEAAEPFMAKVRYFIAMMVEEYRKAEKGYELAIEGLLNGLMSLIIRNVPLASRPCDREAPGEKDYIRDRIRHIIDYIQAHYAEKISLECLAAEVCVNPYYLSHFFREKIGLPFQQYLNYVRLQNASAPLTHTDKQITAIAELCGFSSVKAFIRAFRQRFCVTPSEYRKRGNFQATMAEKSAYMEYDSLQAMVRLREYTQIDTPVLVSTAVPADIEVLVDCANCVGGARGALFPNGKALGAVGRAYDCLRADMREQIADAVRELGIEYLRFHGLFSDEMHVVRQGPDNKLSFHWDYVDQVFDFLISVGVAPLPDLTFIPSELKSRDTTVMWYQGNIAPPRNFCEWEELIYRFAAHCLERYGAKELRRWYFEVWNEPDFMWAGTPEDYYCFFEATVRALKRVDPLLRVAGPSVTIPNINDGWIDAFIDFLNEKNLPLDCFTLHIYDERGFVRLGEGNAFFGKYGSRDHFAECVAFYQQKLQRLTKPPVECFVTEYNISANHDNYLLDTMFTACHLLYNFLRNHKSVQGAAVWTLSDIFEEDGHLNAPFSGGFGLVSAEGIRKPNWYALWFLSKIRGEILEQGEEYIITRREGRVFILAFRYLYYDKVYQEGDRSLLRYDSRYEVFEAKGPASYAFSLRGLSGDFRLREYTLDREHGSAYDLYSKMGRPQTLGPDEIAYLRGAARPHLSVRKTSADPDGIVRVRFTVQGHGVKLIELTPLRD